MAAPKTSVSPSSAAAVSTTTTTTRTDDRLPVWFGQRRIAAVSPINQGGFGRIDNPVSNFEENFRLAVFWHPEHPDVLIAINNRNLAALSLAGMTTAWACLASPTDEELDRLEEEPLPPATSLPTPVVAVTVSQANPTPVPPYEVTSTVSLRKEALLPC